MKEGEEVDVLVQSIDKGSRRISLSMKGLTPAPEGEQKGKKDDEPGEPAQKATKVQRSAKKPLKGGRETDSEGRKFGLKLVATPPKKRAPAITAKTGKPPPVDKKPGGQPCTAGWTPGFFL